MSELRYLTAGESHGRCLTAILEGMVSGLLLSTDNINCDLLRRQKGYGRGGRMQIERDTAEILSGVRKGRTTGAPISILIANRDSSVDTRPELTRPRPGHADLAGCLKYASSIRDVLERASARETAARVAVGAVCREFLAGYGVRIISHVTVIGGIQAKKKHTSLDSTRDAAEESVISCADAAAAKRMIAAIKKAADRGDTLGGIFEIVATGLAPGIGSYVHADRKLDGRLAASLMSIQGIKAVNVGLGFGYAATPGSRAHDEIFYGRAKGLFRRTNNAGGIEGGMTNGEPVVVRCCMKPISTLRSPLNSVHIETLRSSSASFERSDVCAVPSAAVVGEAAAAFEIARAFLEKFGGDSLRETTANYRSYLKQIKRYFR